VAIKVLPDTFAADPDRRARFTSPAKRRWARHGSTRWPWKPKNVAAAMQYVIAEQREPMSAFESHEP
jgi:hypothetical protein